MERGRVKDTPKRLLEPRIIVDRATQPSGHLALQREWSPRSARLPSCLCCRQSRHQHQHQSYPAQM
jgi:hypothetical protein